MRNYQCNACGIRICTAEYQDGSGVPFKCTGGSVFVCHPQWKEIERETATLPKLTTEVFDRPDCPKNVQYAVVTSEGRVVGYINKPYINKEYDCWGFNAGCSFTISVDGTFDPTDWQNSLVERPVKLPAWCKEGEWFWHPEDMAGGRYLKITEIRGGGVYAKEKEDYDPDYLCFDLMRKYSKQARLRPYNAEEMESMVGLTVKGVNSSEIITGFKKNKWGNFVVKGACGWYDAKHLLENFTAYGSPCGVLEHLEDGEWVK